MQSGWRNIGIARLFQWVMEAMRWTFEVSAVPGGSTGCWEAAYKISNWERGATLREVGSETRCQPRLPMFPGERKRSKRPNVRNNLLREVTKGNCFVLGTSSLIRIFWLSRCFTRCSFLSRLRIEISWPSFSLCVYHLSCSLPTMCLDRESHISESLVCCRTLN